MLIMQIKGMSVLPMADTLWTAQKIEGTSFQDLNTAVQFGKHVAHVTEEGGPTCIFFVFRSSDPLT